MTLKIIQTNIELKLIKIYVQTFILKMESFTKPFALKFLHKMVSWK